MKLGEAAGAGYEKHEKNEFQPSPLAHTFALVQNLEQLLMPKLCRGVGRSSIAIASVADGTCYIDSRIGDERCVFGY
jgi:hypothetical protein